MNVLKRKIKISKPFLSLISVRSEILLEERVSDCETMRRENRRVAAMSWGAGDEMPPPKPARVPHAGLYTQTRFAIFNSIRANSMRLQIAKAPPRRTSLHRIRPFWHN